MTSLITAFVFRYERRPRTLPAHSREHTSMVANSHTVLRLRPMNVQSSSACSSRISKPRNIRSLKRVAAVEARSSHRAMVLRERPVTRAGRRDAHALDAQARDLVELPSTAAKTGVHCPRVRAERLPAHLAAVPPPSARLRCKRAVAHDVEARFSEIVAPGARHLVDRVHRASVPGRETRGFAHDLGGEGDRSTATGASTRMCAGTPWVTKSWASVSSTSIGASAINCCYPALISF